MGEKTSRELQSYTLNKAFFFYAVKKTERLARAVYLITNFFSESEPLKWKLRSENLSLLESFSRAADSSDPRAGVDASGIKHSLSTVLATLGVAYTAGLISEMNFAVLRHEYEALLDSLESELDGDGKHTPLLFPKDFFDVKEERRIGDSLEKYLYGTTFEKREERALRLERSTTTQQTSQETKSGEAKANASNPNSKGQSSSLKDIKDIKDIKRTSATQQPAAVATSSSRTSRRDVILQLVKDKKEISVKDAAREIQDCSAKTLQREIVALVDDGTLERIGSRRWSRYRLAGSS